jgi:hypothetical protein
VSQNSSSIKPFPGMKEEESVSSAKEREEKIKGK